MWDTLLNSCGCSACILSYTQVTTPRARERARGRETNCRTTLASQHARAPPDKKHKPTWWVSPPNGTYILFIPADARLRLVPKGANEVPDHIQPNALTIVEFWRPP